MKTLEERIKELSKEIGSELAWPLESFKEDVELLIRQYAKDVTNETLTTISLKTIKVKTYYGMEMNVVALEDITNTPIQLP